MNTSKSLELQKIRFNIKKFYKSMDLGNHEDCINYGILLLKESKFFNNIKEEFIEESSWREYINYKLLSRERHCGVFGELVDTLRLMKIK